MTRIYHKKGTQGTIPIDLSDVNEPPWLKEISPHSSLNARDLMEVFKISRTCLDNMVKDGRLPRADYTTSGHRIRNGEPAQIKQWTVKTIRDFFKQQRRSSHHD